MKNRTLLGLGVLCVVLIAIVLTYFGPFTLPSLALLRGQSYQIPTTVLPVGSIGAMCLRGKCITCRVSAYNAGTCVYQTAQQCRDNCVVSPPVVNETVGCCKRDSGGGASCETITAQDCREWGGTAMFSCQECWESVANSSRSRSRTSAFSSWGGYPSSAPISSRYGGRSGPSLGSVGQVSSRFSAASSRQIIIDQLGYQCVNNRCERCFLSMGGNCQFRTFNQCQQECVSVSSQPNSSLSSATSPFPYQCHDDICATTRERSFRAIDENNDRKLTVREMMQAINLFSLQWTTNNVRADYNNNGTVDPADLDLLLWHEVNLFGM